MTIARSATLLNVSTRGKKSAVVRVGKTEILFFNGQPVALTAVDNDDVLVLDAEHSRAAMKEINLFTGASGYQIRANGPEFDWTLSTALMSQLRTLTRPDTTNA